MLPVTEHRRVDVTEGDRDATLELTVAQAAAFAARGIGSVTPLPSGRWRISGIRKVGVVRLDDMEVHVHPKTPIARLFTLLSRGKQWGEWFDENVDLSQTDQLLPSIAEVFGRWGDRVLRAGVLQGYREHRAAEAFIRGRWLVTEQISRRRGMPLPAELIYDEYTTDIPANQIARSAARRLLALGGLPVRTRARLHRIDMRLASVAVLPRGIPLPDVEFDRRNAYYRPLLELARLVLQEESLEYAGGRTSASGFLLNVAKIFEDFVTAEFARHARTVGGRIIPQFATTLDYGGHITIKPDLVWRRDGVVRAVLDAKYKVVHNDSFPNADIYQMVAYCVRHNIPEGHLIYAEGEEVPVEIAVRSEGVDGPPIRVMGHAVDLSLPMPKLEARLSGIAARAFGPARP